MELDSISASYKLMPLWKRLFMVTLIGIVPVGFLLFDEAIQLGDDLMNAQANRDRAEEKFEKAKEQAENLPNLEEKLAFTEAELLDASKKLPDEFVMDRVLQKTAMIAQDVGIGLRVFDPGEGLPSETAFKYMELPIRLELLGTYGQIATFFDRIVHLELLVHIKNIDLSLSSAQAEDAKIENENLTPDQIQRKSRSNTRILATAEMVIFRTLSETETSAINNATKVKKSS